MGSFSWMRADMTTQRANLTEGDSYKILVPIEFGGGYIKDKYWDYGYVNPEVNDKKAVYVNAKGEKYTLTNEHDLYGILAWWNKDKFDGDMKYILECVKTCADEIRGRGIDIGCYDNQINKLKFPLKLVSSSYKGTYEDCDMRSYGDPEQGFTKKNWDSTVWYRGTETYADFYYKCTQE